jgi:hypothetical protein
MSYFDPFKTAELWHGGQSSALYSFLSTGKIHSEEHREDLKREIEWCLKALEKRGSLGLPGEDDTDSEDAEQLYDLLDYVSSEKLEETSTKKIHNEVAPPGFEKAVKAMKKNKEVDNPFAVAWSMKNKDDKPSDVKEADDDDDHLLLDDECDPEACPGCGCKPGEGVNPKCDDSDGCGYWKAFEKSASAPEGRSMRDMLKSPLADDDEGIRNPYEDRDGFETEAGEWIENPFWDEGGRDEVDPEEHYGDSFTKSKLAKRLRWGESVDPNTRHVLSRMNDLAEVDLVERTINISRIEKPIKKFLEGLKIANSALESMLAENFDRQTMEQIKRLSDKSNELMQLVRLESWEPGTETCECGSKMLERASDGTVKCGECQKSWASDLEEMKLSVAGPAFGTFDRDIDLDDDVEDNTKILDKKPEEPEKSGTRLKSTSKKKSY